MEDAHISAIQRAFTDGVLLDINIGKATWTITLTPAMMGLEKFPDNWKSGRCLIMPEDKLLRIAQIEGAARRFVLGQSLQWGRITHSNLRFVPNKKVLPTMIRLGEMQAEFFEAVNDLITSRQELQDQMKKNFPEQWPMLEKFYDITDAQIKEKYYFNYEANAISFPTQMQGIDVEEALRRSAIEGEITDEYKTKAEQELLKIRNNAVAKAETFIQDTIRSVRGKVVAAFTSVAEKIKTGKPVTETNIKSIREVVNYVRGMDFLDDREFRKHMDQVEKVLENHGTFNDDASATVTLESILNQTLDYAAGSTEAVATETSRSYFGRSLNLPK